MVVEFCVELYEVSRTKVVRYYQSDKDGEVVKPVELLLSSNWHMLSDFTNMHLALCSCLPKRLRKSLPEPPSPHSQAFQAK